MSNTAFRARFAKSLSIPASGNVGGETGLFSAVACRLNSIPRFPAVYSPQFPPQFFNYEV